MKANHSKPVPAGTRKPVFRQRMADRVTALFGSWEFLILLLAFIALWAMLNTYFILIAKWDPYPFILLNLFLSSLAAIQAPVILMSQNREAEIDRERAKRDYYVNRKSEKEIKMLFRELLIIKGIVSNQPLTAETTRLQDEIKKIQLELDSLSRNLHK